MPQQTFNSADFTFAWTDPMPGEAMGWYTWDDGKARKLALQARNARVKELRKQGYNPRVFSIPGQTITRGGIGTPHPEISMVVSCYGINY